MSKHICTVKINLDFNFQNLSQNNTVLRKKKDKKYLYKAIILHVKIISNLHR